ncbi:MAG: hypothetical protein AAGF88_00425 [Pseudomonadota bacterium]
MRFIRPEAAQVLTRWREVLVLGALALLGAWIALRPGFFVPVAGWALLAFSVLLMPISIQRAQFRPGADGIGVVQLREGRVIYFGPETGGTVSLDELSELGLVVTKTGRHWHLRQGADVLDIPVDALGADQLFDAFARLRGLNSARLLDALDSLKPGEITLWSRADHPALTPDLPRSTSER